MIESIIKLQRQSDSDAESRPYDVLIDGKKVNEIREDQTINIPLSLGNHTLQVKVGLKKSNVAQIHLEKQAYSCYKTHRKEVTKRLNLFSMVVWGGCCSLGAILSPGIGSGVGLGVGYLLRRLMIDRIVIYQ